MSSEPQALEGKRLTAVYAPFKSFITSLDYLKQGLPDQIDVSVWPTFSNGLRGQLIAAYKFLGLIDENGFVQMPLPQLVKDTSRRDVLKALLKTAYHQLFALDLSRATPNQLADALRRSYNVDGSTLEKAQTFFLHAARFVGLPLSPSISRKTRTAPKRKRGIAAASNSRLTENPDENVVDSLPSKPRGDSKTIKLHGDGNLTISSDVPFFSMDSRDRRFVFDLIEQLERYERNETVAVASQAKAAMSSPAKPTAFKAAAGPVIDDDPFRIDPFDGGADDDVPF